MQQRSLLSLVFVLLLVSAVPVHASHYGRTYYSYPIPQTYRTYLPTYRPYNFNNYNYNYQNVYRPPTYHSSAGGTCLHYLSTGECAIEQWNPQRRRYNYYDDGRRVYYQDYDDDDYYRNDYDDDDYYDDEDYDDDDDSDDDDDDD